MSNNNSHSPTSSPEDIVQQTEILVKQLLQHTNENRENLTEESIAVVRNVQQLAESCLKEKQHAAAVQLHVEQLEKIIVRLRSERDLTTSPGTLGRGTPSKFIVLESELDNYRIQLEQANDQVLLMSKIVNEKDSIIVQLQENVTAADAAVSNLDAQLREVQQANETLLQQLQLQEANFASYQEVASNKFEELQLEVSQKQAAINALSANVGSESAVYHDILEQFNEHMTNGISVFAVHVSDSLASLVRGNGRLVHLQQSLQHIQQALTDRDAKITHLTAELRDKEAAIEAASNDAKLLRQYLLAKSDEVGEIRQQADSLTEELSAVTIQKTEFESALNAKEEALSEALANFDEAQSKSVMLAEGFETISEQLERYKFLLEKSGEDLSAERSKNSHLQAKISELESLVQQANSQEELVAKITDLQQKLEEKDNEIICLRSNFDAEERRHREEMAGLQRDIDTFQQRIGEMDQLLPQLHFQLIEAHRNQLSLNEQCETLRKSLSENEATIQSMKAELSEKTEKLSELDQTRSHCEHLQSKLGVLTGQLVERNSEIDELGSRIQELEKALNSSSSEITNQVASLSQAKQDLEEQLRLKSAECEELTLKLSQSSEEVGKLNKICQDSFAQVENLDKQIYDSSSEIDRLSSELKGSSDEIARLNNVLAQQTESSRQEVEAVNRRFAESQNEMQRFATACSEEISRLNHLLELRSESGSAEVNDLTAKLSHSHSEIERLSSNLQAGSDEIERLKQLLEQEKETANSQIGDMTNQIGQFRHETQRLSSELQTSSDEIARLNHQLSLGTENERASLRASSEEIARLNQVLEQQSSQISVLNSELAQSDGEIDRLANELKVSWDEVARLKQQEDSQRLDVENLTVKLGECQTEVQRLSDDVSRLNHLLGVEAESSSAEIEELNKELSQSRAEVERLSSELKTSSDETLKLKSVLEQSSESSSRELVELRQRIEAESKLNSHLNEQNDQLLNERNALADRCHSYEADLNKLASYVSSFVQFVDSKFAKIWARLDHLIQRFLLLQRDAGFLAEAHRFVLATVRDVRTIMKAECPQLLGQVMAAIEPAFSGLEQRLAGCQGNFSKLTEKIVLFKEEVEMLSKKPDNFDSSSQTSSNFVEISELESLQDQKSAEIEELRREIEKRDEQLVVFSQELKKMHENEQQLMLQHERHVQSLQKPDLGDTMTQTLENYISPEDFENLQNALAYNEQQLQAANQQILGVMEEVKSYKDAAKRADRRFHEADQAAKTLAQDSQNMAQIVASLREKLKSSEEKLAATEIARVQTVTQLSAIQSTYSTLPSPEQSAEIAAECDRLRNKVKFMTDQFELAVSRSALLERSLHEKEDQCERLARELGLERQRLLSFEKDGSPPPSNLPSPSRESSPVNSHSTRVDLRQYFDALPVPVKRAFDRVRHSQAAAVTLSASQRFNRIVQQSPIGNAMRQFSVTTRHHVFNRMSPAKLQFIVTVYVCFLHMLTLFYMFTCYGPPKPMIMDADTPPHFELQKPVDM